jgi:hypothetical protein
MFNIKNISAISSGTFCEVKMKDLMDSYAAVNKTIAVVALAFFILLEECELNKKKKILMLVPLP